MSSNTKMVGVENLGKLYKIAPKGTRPGTLTENLLATLRGKQSPKEDFWAVRSLSFEVHQGEVVGLIGHDRWRLAQADRTSAIHRLSWRR